jgi:hypothetical protein
VNDYMEGRVTTRCKRSGLRCWQCHVFPDIFTFRCFLIQSALLRGGQCKLSLPSRLGVRDRDELGFKRRNESWYSHRPITSMRTLEYITSSITNL